MASASNLPESYNTFQLPDLILSHHPESSPTVTPVVLIKLHRPRERNAFTDRLGNSLVAAYDALSADPRVRCIVLASSDPAGAVFCAGMDLHDQINTDVPQADYRDIGGIVGLAMERCTKPIIAAISGSAVGIGVTMTLPATIRVASKDAKVGFVFSRRGFNMEAASSFYLPRLVGASRALHLVTTGGVYPASHRLFDGLFSEVVSQDRVLPSALEIADDIAANASIVSARVMRDLILRSPSSPEEAHLLESKLFWDLFRGRDTKEGIDSFMQKRRPDFKGTIDEDAPTHYPWWQALDTKTKVKSKI
ncbi:hypothetical protein N3K66_005486 [Trichothecium roseum]|uniref:Uncharacterized protein n=1 Tax=Trichothecium roseum TaxID=47278 RepID=A0ACC0UZT2_9HYPO|nr:hypothetical protein N3K66_005486 [Trichothecium roseum]